MPTLPNPKKMTCWKIFLIIMLMLSSSVTARKLAETSNPSATGKEVPGEKVFVRFLGDYGDNPTYAHPYPTDPIYPPYHP